LVKISGYVVTAGKLRPDIGQRMATSAKQNLKECLQDPGVLFGAAHADFTSSSGPAGSNADAAAAAGSLQQQPHINRDPGSIPTVVLDINAAQESTDRAFGDGGSIVLVAETSTGCLFGASALAERGVTAEALGAMAARDLLEELRTGAAVDQW
jgi:RNA 3'-terminal phosphate cyclase